MTLSCAFYSVYIQPKNKEEILKQNRAGKTLGYIRIGVLAPYYHRILNRWHIYAFQSSQILENLAAQESIHGGGWRWREATQSMCFSNWQESVTHSHVTTSHKDAHGHPIFIHSSHRPNSGRGAWIREEGSSPQKASLPEKSLSSYSGKKKKCWEKLESVLIWSISLYSRANRMKTVL